MQRKAFDRKASIYLFPVAAEIARTVQSPTRLPSGVGL